MNFDSLDKKITQAYEKAVKLYENREGVLSVEIGLVTVSGKITQEIGVILYVDNKTSMESLDNLEKFPRTIDDVRVDVVEENLILKPFNQRSEKCKVIQPGISISSNYSTSGTLGLLVRDNISNKICILSNWHVLAKYKSYRHLYVGSKSYRKGAPIYQPGRLHKGRDKKNIIARLSRHSRSLDAAIAVLDETLEFNVKQFESDIEIKGIRHPKIGDILEISGARTGLTRARVVGGIESGTSFTLKPILSADQDIEISDSGDSGSIWYDPETHEAVGLHFAGEAKERYSEFARAKSIVSVFEYLNISLL